MPAPPKSLVNLVAGYMTKRLGKRLKKLGSGVAAQQAAYRQLIGKFARTAFGREAGVEVGLTYERFRTRVAPRTFEQLAPFIERMKQGEADVLWPGRCAFYAVTAGTTGSAAKHLPVTEEMLAHFRRAGLDSLLLYAARAGHAGVFLGRHLALGGSTTLAPLASPATKPAAYTGDLSAMLTLSLPRWAEKHLCEPGGARAQTADWTAQLEAIARRTLGRDITLLAGIPNWLLELADVIRTRVRQSVALQDLWPNLECLVHSGVPLAPFADELRRAVGPTVNFHEVYPACEGFIAAQDGEAAHGLRLLADAGLFFEFLPLRDFDEANLAHLGPKAVPLEEVKPGIDYALLLTTPAGLCRYVLGDIVRFISTHPPRLIYVGRTRLQLNAFGEHVSEKELTDALLAVCQRNDWLVVNFHVAPLPPNLTAGTTHGRHEWWIELRPGTVKTPTGPVLAGELDLDLAQHSRNYAAKRQELSLEPPVVRLVMPGSFEKWMQEHGKWGGQSKMPRSRPDRLVADQFAAFTRFAAGATQSPFAGNR